jgi:hypothetical protein
METAIFLLSVVFGGAVLAATAVYIITTLRQ